MTRRRLMGEPVLDELARTRSTLTRCWGNQPCMDWRSGPDALRVCVPGGSRLGRAVGPVPSNLTFGRWPGKICQTEPHCGTDLGLARRACIMSAVFYKMTDEAIRPL